MKKYSIRFLEKTDIPNLVKLCEAHAIYEQAEYAKEGKAKHLEKDIFSLRPKLYCLVVEDKAGLLGFATYMKQYSTWDASEYIYMDCLFLIEQARGFGIGEKLILQIKEEATKLGCSLIQWQTPEFNTRAVKFYKRIGAASKSKERFFLEVSR